MLFYFTNVPLLLLFLYPLLFSCSEGRLTKSLLYIVDFTNQEAGVSGLHLITQVSENNDKVSLRCAFREVCG